MRMGKDPFEEQRLLGQIQLGQSQVLEAFIEKRMGVLNKQLQDEREENYRLRLKIQELEDKIKDEQLFSRMLVPSCAQLLSRQWHAHYAVSASDWDSVRIAEFLKALIEITQKPGSQEK